MTEQTPRKGERRAEVRREVDRATHQFTAWVQSRFRNATLAFILLSIANATAIGWIYDTRNNADKNDTDRQAEIARQQKDIAQILSSVQAGRRTTLDKICDIDNGQNKAIRAILREFNIEFQAFLPIDCDALVDSANADREPDKPGSLQQQKDDGE